ncbi:rhamnulokinase [Muribaculum sp.]|jgi:rhamnulokinase|uniref:rhamnulokinase n=1 Tax=Muribaculum sp. TaxID=1918611 RepID=UPI0025798555|nr:rhamnulokinase [Muribaculum sp.]
MTQTKHYLAVDLGATSGRVILGTLDGDRLQLEELARFPNKIIRTGGHYYWDLYALYDEILGGLREAARRGIDARSIGIDTWGVDFVFFDKNGQLLGNPVSYRDPHTVGEPERFFKQVPAEEVYKITGIQVMNFNSLFQFSALRRQNWVALDAADKILFIPDALGYMMTGNAVTEYTIASTSEMLNPVTKKLDAKLLEALSLTEDKFGKIVYPGDKLGTLTQEMQDLTGLGAVPVISVAGHDTASAVAAVPATTKDFAYLSSGTWSLMGIESDDPIITERSQQENFTNEGGIQGTTRFLKNICGMWLLERCRAEWKQNGIETDYGQLIAETAKIEPFRSFIYPDAACFAMPDSMLNAIADYCRETGQPVPETPAEYARCIFDSLAMRYREVFLLLKELSGMNLDILHVIGGGCRNKLLNQLTANAVGVPVVAGPVEGTALGNIMIQAQADGAVKNLAEIRATIAKAIETERFEPKDADIWAEAYAKYLKNKKQ